MDIAAIHAGDTVVLSGTIFTARDAAHKRLMALLDEGRSLPYGIAGTVVYYAGPCPAPPGLPIGACGPTTSSRMDAYAPRLIALGQRVMIGKGQRADAVIQAIVENKGLYLAATGGAGALIARCVKSARVIAFADLGAEAVHELTVEGLPLIAAIDCHGGNLYQSGPAAYRVGAGENDDAS
jgi:fumarate hydratase subunit beta